MGEPPPIRTRQLKISCAIFQRRALHRVGRRRFSRHQATGPQGDPIGLDALPSLDQESIRFKQLANVPRQCYRWETGKTCHPVRSNRFAQRSGCGVEGPLPTQNSLIVRQGILPILALTV